MARGTAYSSGPASTTWHSTSGGSPSSSSRTGSSPWTAGAGGSSGSDSRRRRRTASSGRTWGSCVGCVGAGRGRQPWTPTNHTHPVSDFLVRLGWRDAVLDFPDTSGQGRRDRMTTPRSGTPVGSSPTQRAEPDSRRGASSLPSSSPRPPLGESRTTAWHRGHRESPGGASGGGV